MKLSKACPDCGETEGWKLHPHSCHLGTECVLAHVVRCSSCHRFEGYDKEGKLLQATRGNSIMKIYKLGRIGDDGKKAFYDEATGFVVLAESPSAARQIASKQPGDEGPEFWLDPKKSYCRQVDLDRQPQIVLRAFDAG